jgi:predicted MPP superfamily phosphohydrolase
VDFRLIAKLKVIASEQRRRIRWPPPVRWSLHWPDRWNLSWLTRWRVQWGIVAVIAVGLVGGALGVLLGGHAETAIGPADVGLALHAAWTGDTVVNVPPLGTLRLDTHDGPLRIVAQIDQIRPERAQRLLENPNGFETLTAQIGGQVRHGIVVLAVKSTLAAAACAGLTGLIVFRSWRRACGAALTAVTGIALAAGLAGLTFDPQSIAEPRYSGLLSSAPSVVGDAKSIVRRFEEYRAQLARLVGNLSRLYAASSTLPTYEPDPTTVRVLHVSDIHLGPTAWTVIRSVSRQFQVQAIVDTGDLTDHGSRPESRYIEQIESLQVPYVFVRGNHDSRDTQKAVDRQKNAVVLDGGLKEVAGLTIYGIGDPRFTPDKTTRDDERGAADMSAEGQRVAGLLRTAGVTPDIVAVHDPNEGQAFDGVAPLVLSGHAHQRSTRLLPTGTRLFVQGSTGAAGLRGLEHEQPTPIQMSILYFNRVTHRLQAWDDIQLGGLGLSSAQITRTLEKSPDRAIKPSQPPPASPGGASPSGSPGEGPATPAVPSTPATPGANRTSSTGRRPHRRRQTAA